jgi:hypothetical protein
MMSLVKDHWETNSYCATTGSHLVWGYRVKTLTRAKYCHVFYLSTTALMVVLFVTVVLLGAKSQILATMDGFKGHIQETRANVHRPAVSLCCTISQIRYVQCLDPPAGLCCNWIQKDQQTGERDALVFL